ncbi:hypothetical protein V8V91_17845 [Algoriphagus halophilus]|uniref:DUF7507 domain-containing protein n=1 Tax=Algoriphagus halophilus TaxID=226505 RepID=UPI00358FAE87
MINYEIEVSNIGNITITDIVVDDNLTGLNIAIGTLLPNETATVPTSYTVTQGDIDGGRMNNVATATGR